MKKYFMLLLSCILLFSACSINASNENKGKEQHNMKTNKLLPVSDFENLYQHTLDYSEKNQSVENIAKIYFYEVENLLSSDVIAIDLQNRVAQLNPNEQQRFGEKEFEINLSEQDINDIKGILKNGKIENWKDDYEYGEKSTLEQMGGEGYNWNLILQYEDGTMVDKRGKGTVKNEIQPEGYKLFVEELTAFVNSIKDK